MLEGEHFSLGGYNFTCASSSTLYRNRFQVTMIACDGLFSSVLWRVVERDVNWAAAQLDWPTLSSREVFSATKKHIFSAEILIADIAAHVAFRQQTRMLRYRKESCRQNVATKVRIA